MTLVFVGAASLPFFVSAAQGTHGKAQNKFAFERALDSNDYISFKNLLSTHSSVSISEEIFHKLVQARALQKAGDKVGAEKIMTELGLKKPSVDHMKGFFRNLTDTQKENLKHAKELAHAGRGEEAKTLLLNAGIKIPEHRGPFLGEQDGRFANLTDTQKTAMKEARTLIKAGKMDEAKKILDATLM